MALLHRIYRTPGESSAREAQLVAEANATFAAAASATVLSGVSTELCFYVEFAPGVQHADLTAQRALDECRVNYDGLTLY